jgi:hypothetical protein
VTEYRLYFFDAEGHIRHAHEFVCASDEEAIQAVEQHHDGGDLELWSGARVIQFFPGKGPAGEPSSAA